MILQNLCELAGTGYIEGELVVYSQRNLESLLYLFSMLPEWCRITCEDMLAVTILYYNQGFYSPEIELEEIGPLITRFKKKPTGKPQQKPPLGDSPDWEREFAVA